MTRTSPIRFGTTAIVWGALVCASGSVRVLAQTAQPAPVDQAASAQLLGKAHALEVRGRIDMAKQTWQQVLLVDPNNAEALAGLARAAKLEGRDQDVQQYLDRLRAINPNDPNIERVQQMTRQQNTSVQLTQAGKLAQSGQYARAMVILRQVYGDTPPPGDAALSYYQTEAATDDGRAHAIAGLRALVDKYPDDSRYQIALGKILTYNPRTRAEGRKLLEKHPSDPDAAEALRQSLVWDAQNPATSADIRNYLAHHKDQQLSTALAQVQAQQKAAGKGSRGPALTPDQLAAQEAYRARSAEVQAAYKALNAKHIDDAEAQFKAIVAKNPQDAQALAGLGYVRMNQSNFGGAISFLEQAQQDGLHDPAVDKALRDSRFYYTMQQATTALNENDLVTAQAQFQAALGMRNNDPEALLGLGGTLLKAQQSEPAMQVFATFVKVKPSDKAAWRGLFMAEYGAGKYTEALATDRHVPSAVHAQLMKDPDYLRTLSSTYSALGRDADAQRVLRSALDLPFPADGHGLKIDMQLQYAALLSAANHKEQAIGLYRQVLATDSTNTNAWVGLIQNEHELGQDQAASDALQAMSPASYNAAMQEAGFETTVAAIYEGAGKDDAARDILEKFLAQQQEEGKKTFVPAQVQLAGIYMRHGDEAEAYPLYRQILSVNGDRADAWRGLLSALHSTGHDQEAVAELQQMPPEVRKNLENDPSFLTTVGSIYAALGQPQEAALFLGRARKHYTDQHVPVPADIDVQTAWLLYNSHNDDALYTQLMALGSRPDLTDQQRRTVQTIWANFAVRRADAAAQAGNPRKSLAILNAAAKAFPDNPDVIKALANGYAANGLPKQAVVIYKAQNLQTASAADYKSAIGAALADNDLKDAETWLRFGLQQYPKDPQMLQLAAKFEEARGDANLASEYYRASLKLMPAPDPGLELSGELSRPAPAPPAPKAVQQPQDLSTLLAPGSDRRGFGTTAATPMQQSVDTRPYLPSYNSSGGNAPVVLGGPSGYGSQNYSSPANPYGTTPTTPSTSPGLYQGLPGSATPPKSVPNSTLKDYVPQAQLESAPSEAGVLHLHPNAATESIYGPYVSYVPVAESAMQAPEMATVRFAGHSGDDTRVRMQTAAFQQNPAPQSVTADGTPIVPYADVAKPVHNRAPSAAAKARARAAAIRENQDTAPAPMFTGVSHPPAENINADLTVVQFNPAQQQAAQVPQAQAPSATVQNAVQQQGDCTTGCATYGQQYPQPNTRSTSTHVRSHSSSSTQQQTTEQPVQAQPQLSYPSVPGTLSNPGYPQIGAPYPLGQAPSDQDLIRENVPPLRGYYDPRVEPNVPLTDRQQVELNLAVIEGSYSPWVGGSVIGRYRSGTPGIDRLSALEVPFEASVVANKTIRFTIIPTAVFLNNGQLNTTDGSLGTQAVLGTLPGNAITQPSQQFASGVGGEFQAVTNTFAAAIGYTPYEFLVSNVIGRVQWRPGGKHFTFFGGRDAVKETELSYAGLRDPGSATPTFGGNVWGGVVQTGGGVRFDTGDERAGLYIIGEGADLSGYHVLENRKYDGTMGAYFRVKTWPQYGTLNVGGTFFGEHYDYNERGETYGLGGYFSPEAYFLAAVPVTFNGHYNTDFHYTINGSVGVQTFQEDNEIYFPLDTALQTSAAGACTQLQLTARSCAQMPVNSNTGLNYSIDAEASYKVTPNWFVGAFLSGNNTNNYNTISGGFFLRYLIRPQYSTADYPTGLFPVEGFRPLRVP